MGDRFFDQLDGLRHPRIETDELATLQLPRVMAQDGCVALLSPAEFALCDSTPPNELRLHALFQHYVFRLADPTLRTALRDTQSVTASTVCGQRGPRHLMIGTIQTMASDVSTLAPKSAAAVAESVTQILLAGLSALPSARQQPVSQLTAITVSRSRPAPARGCATQRSPWPAVQRSCACCPAPCTARGRVRRVQLPSGFGRSAWTPRAAICVTRISLRAASVKLRSHGASTTPRLPATHFSHASQPRISAAHFARALLAERGS